jgi:hypothetical protein
MFQHSTIPTFHHSIVAKLLILTNDHEVRRFGLANIHVTIES